MGFGPLGTSWASAPNSLLVCLFLVCLGCKFAVDVAVVDAEGSKRSLLMGAEDAMDDGFIELDKLMSTRKMKRMERKTTKGCDLVWISEMDDEVLGTAMQFGRNNHPPRSHKGSKSMNQHQG
jgi:hypothetical protein